MLLLLLSSPVAGVCVRRVMPLLRLRPPWWKAKWDKTHGALEALLALGTELRSFSSSLARLFLFDDDNVDKKIAGKTKWSHEKSAGKGEK